MRSSATTLTGSQSWPRHRGIVSGYVWKLIRESASMTQFQLAEELHIDVATVQAWESGRRPLTAIRAGDLARFRVQLLRRGARPALFTVLNDAIEADLLISFALEGDGKSALHHPLAATVHRRDLTNLITWPLTGITPTQLLPFVGDRARRGPVANQPILTADERMQFFQYLTVAADSHKSDKDGLLRRQAIYLLAFDVEAATADWLAHEHLSAIRTATHIDDISTWVAIRSSAVALSRYGNQDALLDFVRFGLASHEQEIANLTYWAYWVGEIIDIHINDGFMLSTDMRSWGGAALLAHLLNRLEPGTEQLELNIHTMTQLLLARPHLLAQYPELRLRALATVKHTLDAGGLSPRARQELSNVAYAVRLAAH